MMMMIDIKITVLMMMITLMMFDMKITMMIMITMTMMIIMMMLMHCLEQTLSPVFRPRLLFRKSFVEFGPKLLLWNCYNVRFIESHKRR